MQLDSLDGLSLVATILVICAAALYIYGRDGVRSRVSRRLSSTGHGVGKTDGQAAATTTNPLNALGKLLQALGSRLPLFDAAQRKEMGRKLVSAGYRQAGALPALMGIAAGTALLFVSAVMALAWPALHGQMALQAGSLILGGYLGLLLPRLVLDKLVTRRQRAIERNFPDALDLLVVCTNAGLGLNAALNRVAHELAFLAPELSDEISLTSGQLQLSGDTTDVLHQLADRIGLPSIRSLVSTLVQSRQFGTPIGQALRVLSRSERTARLMRTEEAAAKLATKITLPMMLFILPTVLIVAAGPSVLHLMQVFGK